MNKTTLGYFKTCSYINKQTQQKIVLLDLNNTKAINMECFNTKNVAYTQTV